MVSRSNNTITGREVDYMIANEEEQAEVRSARVLLPTIPGQVTPDTPLESLNLNWRERDLPEKERTKHVHRLHPYLGKFIPQLTEVFLRKYFRRGQTVLDPFVGSGTTLVQANELGINSIGYDISAFNVLLCRAKTAHYDISEMQREVLDILARVKAATQISSSQRSLTGEVIETLSISGMDNEYLQQWFAPRALRELLTYRSFIETGDYQYTDLLKVILSRAARSARLTTHFDLDFPKRPVTEPYWCYKHSRICSPTGEAFKFLNRYSKDTIKRVKQFQEIRTDASVQLFHEDSRKATYPENNGIFTSPPYVGLIDYHEQHAYAYHLLGLQDMRESEIGAASNGSSMKAQERYKKDIAEVFCRASEFMPAGSRIIVVANDRANLYGDIADMVGVEVEGIINRHVNRRTGRRSGEFYESIFVWRKC